MHDEHDDLDELDEHREDADGHIVRCQTVCTC